MLGYVARMAREICWRGYALQPTAQTETETRIRSFGMSFTKNYTPICDGCGRFCKIYDEETPFGCSSYDPPEPHDPSHYCEACSKNLKAEWLKRFRRGDRGGCWHKSSAERQAAAECGLEWIHSSGLVDTRNERDVHYSYILASEKHFYEPYVGYKSKKTA